MLSLSPYALITCPYEDCRRSGAVDVYFKRLPRRSTLFQCPSCNRQFLAFHNHRGDVVTTRAKRHVIRHR